MFIRSAASLPEEGRDAEGNRKHHDARKDGFLSADLRGDEAHRDVGDDRGDVGHQKGQIVIEIEDLPGVDRILAGHGVVAHEPEDHRQKQEEKRDPLRFGKLSLSFLLFPVVHAEGAAFLLRLFHQLGFLDLPEEDQKRKEHHAGHHREEGGVAHQRVFVGSGFEDDAHPQDQDAARRSHQIDHGVGLGAKRLGRHVRHQRHRRRAEGGHGDQDHQKDRDEDDQGYGIVLRDLAGVGLACRDDVVHVIGIAFPVPYGADGDEFLPGEFLPEIVGLALGGHQLGAVFVIIKLGQGLLVVHRRDLRDLAQLGVVGKGQGDQKHRGHDRSDQDIGRPSAEAVLRPVADRAEERQHEKRQDVVQRHDDPRERLRHAELVGQDLGDDGIVGLPEGADQEKRKADENDPFGRELHDRNLSFRARRGAAVFSVLLSGMIPLFIV